jgi:hypothetical protein
VAQLTAENYNWQSVSLWKVTTWNIAEDKKRKKESIFA